MAQHSVDLLSVYVEGTELIADMNKLNKPVLTEKSQRKTVKYSLCHVQNNCSIAVGVDRVACQYQ